MMKKAEVMKYVQQASDFAVEELKEKGLLALYLSGTLLHPAERVANSDIDLFGITEPGFDLRWEAALNKKFANRQDTLCGGFECRFRAFPLQALQKGKDVKGSLTFIRPERMVQRFPFFKYLWGKKFNFKKGFLKPMTLKQEAEYLVDLFKKNIKSVRNGTEPFPYQDLPKHVFELVRVEAQHDYGFKYNPHRVPLVNCLKHVKGHIVHTAMKLRKRGNLTRKEVIAFSYKLEKYVLDLEKKVESW